MSSCVVYFVYVLHPFQSHALQHGWKKTEHHSPLAPKSWANLIPGAGAKGGGTAGAGASDAASPPG